LKLHEAQYLNKESQYQIDWKRGSHKGTSDIYSNSAQNVAKGILDLPFQFSFFATVKPEKITEKRLDLKIKELKDAKKINGKL